MAQSTHSGAAGESLHNAINGTDPKRQSRTLLVLYGSETGTAQDLAHEIGRSAERLRFDTRVMEMNTLDFRLLPTMPLIVFVTSTTGQGDMPSNMMSFWKLLLRKRLPSDFLGNVWFTSFGCGDSAYLKFNWAVKKLHKRVLQLGGREFFGRGEGDEQHAEGLDGAFIPWTKGLVKILLERRPLPDSLKPIPESELLPPKYLLEFDDEAAKAVQEGINSQVPVHIPRSDTIMATVHSNIRVTPEDHFQDVRHITFTLPEDSEVTYTPGDVVSISPQNTVEDVDLFLSLQGWQEIADHPIKIIPSPHPPSLSGSSALELPISPPLITDMVKPFTLRTLLTHHLDITAIPRRSFFAYIANYTNNELHKERLLEFINPEYLDELWDYTTRPRRTIIEVLQEFESVKLDWRKGLISDGGGGIGIMRRRLFSVASCQKGINMPSTPSLIPPLTTHKVSPTEPQLSNSTAIIPSTNGAMISPSIPEKSIEILAAIVKYRTVLKKPRTGLCSRYLATLTPSTNISISITSTASDNGFSSRGILSELQRPLVMVSPGTGVAPMRALAWERLALARQGNQKLGSMILFFGCRNESADFFFRKEWGKWQTDDSVTIEEGLRRVFTAFSRDQTKKRYVQHVMREQARIVYRLLYEMEGIVYVCGSSGRMPQAVREALIEIFERGGGKEKIINREKAEKYLTKMEKEGRYRQETW